jgi:putative membrane protein
MNRFLTHWFSVTIALAVAVWLLSGIHVGSIFALLVAALVLGFVNAVIRPVLVLLTFPITLITLGLFYLVVNGCAFALAAAVVPGFEVESMWSAMAGALVVSIVSWFIGQFTAGGKRRTERN